MNKKILSDGEGSARRSVNWFRFSTLEIWGVLSTSELDGELRAISLDLKSSRVDKPTREKIINAIRKLSDSFIKYSAYKTTADEADTSLTQITAESLTQDMLAINQLILKAGGDNQAYVSFIRDRVIGDQHVNPYERRTALWTQLRENDSAFLLQIERRSKPRE